MNATRTLLTLVCVVAMIFGESSVKADFTFGDPVKVPVVDGDVECFSSDGLEIYFSSTRAVGQGDWDLWVQRRASKDEDWGPPENLGPAVNSPQEDSLSSISSDGLSLYFSSNRPGGCGRYDVYMTTRVARNDPWGPAVNLGPEINSSATDGESWITADGLELYFESYRSGGRGRADIYVATRVTTNDPWGKPVNLGPVVNSAYGEQFLSVSPDGLLLLFCDRDAPYRPGGYGSNDMWMARRASLSDPWESPVNLGPKVNGPGMDLYPRISPDGGTLYFTSDRTGSANWQAPIIPICDFNADGKVDERDTLIMMEHWGQNYPLCDIGPMPWGDGKVDEKDLKVLAQQVVDPPPQALDVPREVVLRWASAGFARVQDVYLGTSFEDVNRADRGNPLGVLVSQGQTATTYDPKGRLEYGRTYYWRVDEVNATPDSTISKGDVWSFTVEPYAYPVKPVNATASSVSNTAMGPAKTIDGSGLSAKDEHGIAAGTMWISKKGESPAWIRYEFDKVYKLHQMWVWNANQVVEPTTGQGARDVTVECSTDGTVWTALESVPQFARGTGEPSYVHNTTVDFGGTAAKLVKLTITSNWGGLVKQYSLSEVRFFQVPTRAREPQPGDTATGVAVDATLCWRPGREAARHEMYVSTDRDAVVAGAALVRTVTEPGLALDSLAVEYDRTYYWKVNEVNDAATAPYWEGDVWSFSTPPYQIVDDFESYNDACKQIFFSWIDGQGHSGSVDCGVAPSVGNSSGSTVGNPNPPFAECVIVHGGRQSMPLVYDNTSWKASSEAEWTFDVAQDWTAGGVKTLVLFFRGEETNGVGQLYVKVNDSKVLYNGTADAMATPRWKQWNIDLTSVGGNLRAVQKLTLGVSGSVKGKLYMDDIRLYCDAPAVPVPTDPGTAHLAAYYPLDGNARDLSGHGLDGAISGDPLFVGSMLGFGEAMVFDGSDDHVDLPIGSLISTLTDSSFATWVYLTAHGGGSQHIFDFGASTTQYMFLTPHQETNGPMRFAIRATNAAESIVDAPAALATGWHHVAAVINGTSKTVHLYLDGEGVGSRPTAALPADLGKTTNNWLGRSQYASDAYFSGTLDDFRIYNRALSSDEVHYLAGDR